MPIELCDKEYIWSSGYIVKVRGGEENPECTIRYTGWDSAWDEVLSWKNKKRLARINYFTKRALCLVELISTKTKKGLWPCIVHFRMPNPKCNDEDRKQAESSLRAEQNVFLEPYGVEEKYLPKYVMEKIQNGGIWLSSKKVKQWKDLDSISFRYKNFKEAYDLALQDDRMTHSCPSNAFESGSLLNRMYRVKVLNEEKYSKVFRMGEFFTSSNSNNEFKSTIADSAADPTTTAASMEEDDTETESEEEVLEPYNFTYASKDPPSKLPPAAVIKGPVYSGTCIKKLSKTGKWNASIDVDGSRISLGPYPTQSQAADAIDGKTEDATVDDTTISSNEAEIMGKVKDMNTVSLAAVVAAEEPIGEESNSFSMQKWTAERVERDAFLTEEQRINNRNRFLELKRLRSEKKQRPEKKQSTKIKHSKRKMTPKKLDLTKTILI